MTVQTTTSRADYNGNGLTTSFAVPFYFLDSTHIKVIRTDTSTAPATVSTLALTTDYSVTGAGVQAGGTLVMNTAPTATQKLAVLRNVPQTQLSHYVPNDPFPSATAENIADQLTMEVQQLQEQASRAVTFPAAEGVGGTLPVAASRANNLFGFDSNGNPVAVAPAAQSATALQALLAGSTGSSLISFKPIGVAAGITNLQSELRLKPNVLRYYANGVSGALVDPTGAIDSTLGIQAAIDAVAAAGGGALDIFPGTYETSAPLRLPSGVVLNGFNPQTTIILKTGNGLGTGTALMRSGTITDSYAKDCVIQLIHLDNQYTTYAQIKDISLRKAVYAPNSIAIYAPRANHILFENVWTMNCAVGYLSYDCWMSTLMNVTHQGCNIGFQHLDDGSGIGTGTSINFINCWCNFDNTITEPLYCFSIYGLVYSTLSSCASDNANRIDGTGTYAYNFNTCQGIVLNGCGAENSKGVLNVAASSITVNAMRTYQITGVSSGTTAMIFADANSILTLTGCSFSAMTSPGTSYNWAIQNGAQVIEINPVLSPSGGGTFISYSGGAYKKTITASNEIITSAAGTVNPALLDTGSNLPTGTGNGYVYTGRGSVSAVAATPISIYNIPFFGAYYVYAYALSSGTNYRAVALVTSDGTTADVTTLKAGANLTITVSGLSIQITSSVNAGIAYTVLRTG